MSYSIKGKIIQISDEKQIKENFKTRDFVIFVENEKKPEYSDHITLQFSQAYCDLLDKFEVGQEVEVKFDVKGKKYEKNGEVKYFNTLSAWKIEFVGAGTAASPQPKQQEIITDNNGDDLPF